MTLNLSNNFSSASLPVVTEDRIFKDNFLQKFNEFIGKISCHESFDCAWYILRILGLRQSCLYNLRIKTKWLKLKYFCPFEKKGGPGKDHLEGKDRWQGWTLALARSPRRVSKVSGECKSQITRPFGECDFSHTCQLSRIIRESPGYGTNLPVSRTGHHISRIKSSFELLCALVWDVAHF